MSTSTRITLEQYHAMIERGDFEPREEHHVELIYGEITPMSPTREPHACAVDFLAEWSFDQAPRDAVRVRVQGPFGIPALDSEPEPDLFWARRADYSTRHPRPAEILLVIEVSDSSLARDRGLKARLYAEAGIADYWLANIPDRCAEVRRDPRGSEYRSVQVYRKGQQVRLLAAPGAALDVDRLFPG